MFNPAMFARNALRSVKGLPATITRGSSTSRPIVVVLARTESVATQDQTIRLEADAQDLFVRASDYSPGGAPVEPDDNDRIVVTMPDRSTLVFDVRSPSSSQNGFNYSDPEKTEMRLHCRRVTTG